MPLNSITVVTNPAQLSLVDDGVLISKKRLHFYTIYLKGLTKLKIIVNEETMINKFAKTQTR